MRKEEEREDRKRIKDGTGEGKEVLGEGGKKREKKKRRDGQEEKIK